MPQMPLPSLRVLRVPVAEIIDLRHRILRADLPRESAMFDGDSEPQTLHLGAVAVVDGAAKIIGCATLVQRDWNETPAWQLRGMAIDLAFQKSGVGRALLQVGHASVLASDRPVAWCNARVPAVGFYQRNGWRVMTEVFEIPTAGPHVKMLREP